MKSGLFCRTSVSICFSLILHFTILFSHAQQSKGSGEHSRTIDSLQARLRTLSSSATLTGTEAEGHDTDRVNTLNALAWELKYSNPDTAILLSTQALKIAEGRLPTSEGQRGVANSFLNLGAFNYLKGDYPKALQFYFNALEINETLNDKKGIAATLGNIGIVYKQQGDYAKAIDHYRKALEIAQELRNKSGMAVELGKIGNVYADQGDYAKAIDHYRQALEIDKELGNKSNIAAWLGNIGIIYKQQGDYANALDHFRQALEIDKELGNKRHIAVFLSNIGLVYWNQGDYANALDHYRQALEIDKELGNKSGMAIRLGNIGLVYAEQGNYVNALDHYRQALEIDKELGDKSGVAADLGNIGIVYADQGDYANALDHYRQALEIDKELGNKRGMAIRLGNIGIAYSAFGDLETAPHRQDSLFALAMEQYRQSIQIADEIGYKLVTAFSRFSMAGLLLKQNHRNVETRHASSLRAISLADTAIAMLSEMHEIFHLKDAYLVRSEADSALGNWQNACVAFLLHACYKDSATGTEMQKEVGRTARMWEILSVEKEIEVKEKETARLLAAATAEQRHRQYTWILVIVITLVAFIIFVVARFGKLIHAGILHYVPVFIPLIVIETIMLFADPYIDGFVADLVFFKALIYVVLALLILPVQRLMERWIAKAPPQPSPKGRGLGGEMFLALLVMCLIHGCGSEQNETLTPSFRAGIVQAGDYEETVSSHLLDSFTLQMNTRKAAYDSQYMLAQNSGNANDYRAAYLLLRPWSAAVDSVHHYTKAMKVGMAKAESDHKLQLVTEKLEAEEEARLSAERAKLRALAGYSGLFALIVMGLGAVLWFSRTTVKPRTAGLLLLLTFFLLFESLLVFSDSTIDTYSAGDPVIKLIASTLLAGALAFLHEKAERRLAAVLGRLKKRAVERRMKY